MPENNTQWLLILIKNFYRKLNKLTYSMYCILILQTLLSNPDVRREIHNPHINCGGETISDFCDGNLFKTHPLFASHPEALQFIVYHDDIEVANALGSKAGAHKLGMCNY